MVVGVTSSASAITAAALVSPAPGLEAHSGDVWTIQDIALHLRSSELAASRRPCKPAAGAKIMSPLHYR